MNDLLSTLRTEWLKIRNYRTFWILLAIITVCIPAFNYVVFDITDNSFPKMNGQNLLGNPFSFPDVFSTVSYNSGILLFIPALLIITLFTNEYSYRTHRQNIIDGWSRARYINIKLVEVLLLALYVTAVVTLTSIYFGYRTYKPGQPVAGWHEYRFIFFFFVEMLDYSLIALLIALLVKRSGLSMGLFFLYMIIEQFVVGIGRNKFKYVWVDYLPQESTDRLIPQPFARKILSPGNSVIWEKHLPLYLLAGGIYILVFIFIINRRFRRVDL